MRLFPRLVFPSLLAVTLLATACATTGGNSLSARDTVVVTCKGYASILSSLALFKSRMDADQIRTVDQVTEIVTPTCNEGLAAAKTDQTYDWAKLLATVNAQLARLMVVQREVGA